MGCFFPCSRGVKSCTWKKVKFGLFSCSRLTADPSSNGAPSVPLSLTLLPPLPSGWMSTSGNKSPAFFYIYLQFPRSCELCCQVPSITHFLKACQVPGETWDMGDVSNEHRRSCPPGPHSLPRREGKKKLRELTEHVGRGRTWG